MILYVTSERGAYSERPNRKLVAIHQTWRGLGFEVELVSGGDVYGAAARERSAVDRKEVSRFRSNPGLTGFQAPLVHSVSEVRDIRHDRLLETLLLERLAGRKPELIWHRATRLHMAPLRVAQKLGIPYVLEWIDRLISYRFSLLHWKAVAADNRRMRAAFRVVVVSERWKRDVISEYAIAPERVVVSYNAVDVDQFTRDPEAGARVRERMRIPADALVVGFVGKYNWYHDAHVIPQAAARLREQIDRPVYWLMVGDGPHRSHTNQVCRDLHVEDIVLREGSVPQDEVPAWLSAMDAGVVPASGGEIICPIKVPEYMAAGMCPVVAYSEANREVVTPGRTGLLFRSGDAAAMAESVHELAANPGFAGTLGSAARQEVVRRFSWRETWGRALQEILELASRPA